MAHGGGRALLHVGVLLVVLGICEGTATGLSVNYYGEAWRVLQRATQASPGPARDDLWRTAASLYETILAAAPSAREAPAAALNGAYAWRQVGQYPRALTLLAKLLETYGSDERLRSLDPSSAQYQESVKFTQMAWDALAAGHVMTFRYEEAADTFLRMAKLTRADEHWRSNAAFNAVTIYAAVGRLSDVHGALEVARSLHPLPAELARAEYAVARAGSSPERDLGAIVRTHGNRVGAEDRVLTAASDLARIERAAGHPEAAVADWNRVILLAKTLDAAGMLLGPSRERAAEAAFFLVDVNLARTWESERERSWYCAGARNNTKSRFLTDLAAADDVDEKLRAVAESYKGTEWQAVALARAGAVWDAVWNRLANASCFPAGPNIGTISGQREWVQGQLAELQAKSVSRYAVARRLAEANMYAHQWLRHAAFRLSLLTAILGDAEIGSIVRKTPDPTQPGAMLSHTANQYAQAPGIPTAPSQAE